MKVLFLSQLYASVTFQVFTSCMWLLTTILDLVAVEQFHLLRKLYWTELFWMVEIDVSKILFFTDIKMEQRVSYIKLIECTILLSVVIFLSLMSLLKMKLTLVILLCSPKCRFEYKRSDTPSRYYCYCGKVEDPPLDPWLVPHSCGQVCEREFKFHVCYSVSSLTVSVFP